MDKMRSGKGRRTEFPPDFVKEVDRLPPDQRRWRMIQFIEEHGEDVEPGDGYGPKVTGSPERHDPPE